MKVKDLQEKLSKLDPNLELVFSTEEDKFLNNGELFKLFDIDDISVSEAERLRNDNREPTLKFGKSESSHPIGIANIISDF